jgi:DNA-binding transcriptional regulator YhcF (GntR family)
VTLHLDRTSAQPLYLQIASAISRSGLLRGSRLPSTRALARHLGVSRNTVLAAYDEHSAAGLITATRGSVTKICATVTPARPSIADLLRQSHYPAQSISMADPDHQPIHLYSPAMK